VAIDRETMLAGTGNGTYPRREMSPRPLGSGRKASSRKSAGTVGQRGIHRRFARAHRGGNAPLMWRWSPQTALLVTLSDVIDCEFSRVQFTPDLMPG